MPKVLIIAYYTPPLGMSGVMRITKFAKYLPRFNWQPIILSVKPIAYYHYDAQLMNDLTHVPIYRSESLDLARLWYRFKLPSSLIKAKTNKMSIFSNFIFFPDAKSPWIPFATQLGNKIIQKEKPALLFATSPPFSSLVVALKLKKKFNLPLTIDFRDPWPTGFIEPPRIIRNRVENLRDDLLKQADAVITVNAQIRTQINYPSAHIIDNGYDPDEFNQPAIEFKGLNIVHTGNIFGIENELKIVMQAIADFPQVRLTLLGQLSQSFLNEIPRYHNVHYLGLHSHAETIAIMKGASLLLYISKPNQAVGLKLYEYFGARKPILAIGDNTAQATQLIKNHQAGFVINKDLTAIKQFIQSYLNQKVPYDPINLERYNRIEQSYQLSLIFNQILT